MVRSEAPKSSAIWSAEDDEMLFQMRASASFPPVFRRGSLRNVWVLPRTLPEMC